MRRYSKWVCTVLVAGTAPVAGCGGDDATPPAVNGSDGQMTARISSVFWSGDLTVDALLEGTAFSLIGRDNNFQEIKLQLANVTTTGTFQMGTGTANVATLSVNSSDVWLASAAGGSGSVVITTLTATRAVGTFAFTGVPKAGSSAVGKGNRVVSAGTFDVSIE